MARPKKNDQEKTESLGGFSAYRYQYDYLKERAIIQDTSGSKVLQNILDDAMRTHPIPSIIDQQRENIRRQEQIIEEMQFNLNKNKKLAEVLLREFLEEKMNSKLKNEKAIEAVTKCLTEITFATGLPKDDINDLYADISLEYLKKRSAQQ